ncbi:hypothetical protein QBC38DRAFT_468094 [Podospora fimiseda]|uniref:Adenosine deaminase domain-containing protein n=1 Tax=Podospora fimiseda TaxID=252190 RepID=A0AAN7BWA9_9PEZI|nr:hypothetical protein QBC38DRAFT_468094 [Podospora fimiseda]
MSNLIDFKALPKIELHAHLSGSISRQTLHEVWLQKQSSTTLQDPLVVMPPGKHDYDLKTFFPLFSSYIYNLVNDAPSLRHTTLAVLKDFTADGVVYLELRTTPRVMPDAGITAQDYIQIILDTINEFETSTPLPTLRTNLILSIDRRNSPAQAESVISLLRHFASQPNTNSKVVGLDLCGDPSSPLNSLIPLTPYFLEAKKSLPHLGLTLHFAEAECSGTDEELDLLLSWGPDRLGHVIHLSDEIKNKVRKRRGGSMGLELCLSCNVHAGMVTGGFEGHHFGEWYKVDETIIVLSTDDVGVFGSPLSNEYALVAKHFGLDRTEICKLARKGINAIFGGEEEKERLRRIMWTE